MMIDFRQKNSSNMKIFNEFFCLYFVIFTPKSLHFLIDCSKFCFRKSKLLRCIKAASLVELINKYNH